MQNKGISGLQFKNGLKKDLRPWQAASGRRKGKGKGKAKYVEPLDEEERDSDQEDEDEEDEDEDQDEEDEEDEADGEDDDDDEADGEEGEEKVDSGKEDEENEPDGGEEGEENEPDSGEESEANDHGTEKFPDSEDQVAVMGFDEDEDCELLDGDGRAPSPPKTPSIASEGDGGGAGPEKLKTVSKAARKAALSMGPGAPPSPDSPTANYGSLEDQVNYLKGLSQDNTYQRLVEAFLEVEPFDTVRLSTLALSFGSTDQLTNSPHHSVDYTRTIPDTQLDNWPNHMSQRSPAGIIL
jgi:hypothetical protein